MCNAWNHPPTCACGWGGDGHSGKSGGGLFAGGRLSDDLADIAAGYVNPNARCPECGATVFFYQSPEGGRVFFDALGPPWPKHPCTDRGRDVIYFGHLDVNGSASHGSLQVSADGWVPFLCDDIKEIPHKEGIFELSGFVADERQTYFVKVFGLAERAPYFLKRTSSDWVEMSTLHDDGAGLKPLNFRGSSFLSLITPLIPLGRPQPSRRRAGSSRFTGNGKLNQKPTTQRRKKTR